ncbi:F-box/LRR-repeat protein At3g48880-like [Phalaenopsis equestris]|uniref:F-box/LRR-repeat protein At3g48880-like n=1 Tax=Phalaenopsis equestris TaxID=78828 RepID=UPI0009E3FC5F|nr:F-box/LRR-repeat protein At3g48880-like [Phalaenopsis equestris]
MADGCRKWEEMEADCLVAVFSKLALDDLAVSVLFVCRSWSAAARDPLCWRVLNFRSLNFMPWSKFARRFTDQNSVTRFSFAGFMKLAVRRSGGLAAELRLPELGSMEDLILASNECPRLRTLALPKLTSENEAQIPNLIPKWENLNHLQFESKPSNFSQLASAISRNCKHFKELTIPCSSIKKEDAAAIVTYLPMLTSLNLSRSFLSKVELMAVLEGCRELERLNASDCVGFEAEDKEVIRKGCRIRVLEVEGSKVEEDGGYETDECDDRYVDVI